MSGVNCHMSRVTCHMSRVTYFLFFYFIFFLPSPPKKYRSYDPHRSRDSVTPVCGIFVIKKIPGEKTNSSENFFSEDSFPGEIFGQFGAKKT